MKGTATRFIRLGAGLLGLVTLGWILTGYAKPGEEEMPYHEGVPTDWSHNHVIFSTPATAEEARELGKEPRYWQQLYRRQLVRNLAADPSNQISEQVEQAAHAASRGGLWSEDLGTNSAPGAGNYPAKFGFKLTTANCASAATPDYVIYSTGLQGTATQASIVAYDNIYSGCSGTVPTVYWAYNTGGLILTSPVMSLDGSQVAFVQTSSALTASLVLLKWQASTTETVSAPVVPNSAASAANYRSGTACPLPCMYQIPLRDGRGTNFDDRTSSLFYDFANDVGWVGGATGWLVKLTGLFNATPTEVRAGGFPVQVNPGNPNPLFNPVYDHKSKNVFVGDGGGFVYKVAATGAAVTQSGQLDFGAGLQDVVLDQTNGLIYAFASSDGTANCAGSTACAAVYVLGTNFAAGNSGSKATVGQSVVFGSLPNPNPLYLGGLDSAYYNSVGGTGSMYVCGNTGARPTLYRLPVTSGALGTAIPISLLAASGKASCSPVTDFPNPNASVSKQELIFFSVQNNGIPCAGAGCMMNFVSLPRQSKTTYKQGEEVLVLNTANNVLYIQTAISISGVSGTAAPTWPLAAAAKTTDGTVTWLNQGQTSTQPLSGWSAHTFFGTQARINDGKNVEIALALGTSGGTAPTWTTTPGGTTTDGSITWINAGPWPNVGLALNGGTGGVVIDGTSNSAGASQVYFFTLGKNTCSTSGGSGGCAMQASQSSLN